MDHSPKKVQEMRKAKKHHGKKIVDHTIKWYESRSVTFKADVLEKLSSLLNLISYYNQDFEQDILDLGMVQLLVRISGTKFDRSVQEKSIQSLSLLIQN